MHKASLPAVAAEGLEDYIGELGSYADSLERASRDARRLQRAAAALRANPYLFPRAALYAVLCAPNDDEGR
jgi:uncharacterized protein YbjQ (UPF0145 family)